MPRNIERDKREADRRKNQLIEAGFRLFSQNGIETVSLQKVADAANVSPATMYKYFLTKEKLLIIDRSPSSCCRAVRTALCKPPSGTAADSVYAATSKGSSAI